MSYSGYMAQEYTSDGLFSIKSDVFSFGVLLLEIIYGKRNRWLHDAYYNLNLIGLVSYWKMFHGASMLVKLN